jgi:hypothetical protein
MSTRYVIRAYLGDDEGVAILAGVKVASMCCRSSLSTPMGEIVMNHTEI